MASRQRNLTEDENQILDEMGLPLNARTAVEEVWKKGPKPLSKTEVKELSNQLRFLIPVSPLMVLVLAANLFYASPALSKLTVFCAVLSWAFDVFLYLFGVSCSSLLILLGAVNPLSSISLLLLHKKKGIKQRLGSLYNDAMNLALVVLLAANGYGITASAIVVVRVFGLVLSFVAKSKVRDALQEAESKPA